MRTRFRLASGSLVIFISIFLLIIGGRFLFGLFSASTYSITTNTVKIANSGSDFFFSPLAYFSSKQKLQEKNESLQAENESLKVLVVDRALLAKENIELRTELGQQTSERKFAMAKIISRPRQSPYDFLIVDLGSANSVNKIYIGQKVFVGERVLIGTIARVEATTATVKLLSTAGEETPVLLGPDRLPGVAVGRGGGNLTVVLPRVLGVVVNDVVTLASSSDFIVGYVGAYSRASNNPFQTVFFNLPLNLYTLKWVKILL